MARCDALALAWVGVASNQNGGEPNARRRLDTLAGSTSSQTAAVPVPTWALGHSCEAVHSPALRRRVIHRDQRRCSVPGFHNSRFVFTICGSFGRR
jgi:hypothetical protein